MTQGEGGGRPPLFKSVKELEKCIDKYKQYLIDEKKPATMAGLAYYTGIDRKSLYNYSKKDKYFPTLKRFVSWILLSWEETAITDGKAGLIFLLKNYGYTDKQEIEHTHIDKYEDMTDEQLVELLTKNEGKLKGE